MTIVPDLECAAVEVRGFSLHPRWLSRSKVNITTLRLGEPDPRLFEMPSGYRIVNVP